MSRAPASPARIATLVAVPVALVVGGVTAFVLSQQTPDSPPASASDPSGATTTVTPTSPVEGVTVAQDPATTSACTDLVTQLPTTLNFGPARSVQGRGTALAWGGGPVVLACGVDKPAGLIPTSQVSQVNGVSWYVQPGVDTSSYGVPGTNFLWTAVDRSAYVGVAVPSGQDAASVISPVSTVIAKVLPPA